MTNRTRNFSILAVVILLLGAAGYVIATKETRLGLDLKGGIELVYQGQPTPQVPVVTQQALDDAVETIRKRTDALGVSEPEIQRSGRDQISVGLPDVQNAERAINQVGSTAQLQFYDWEPNVLGREPPDVPYAGSKALYDAAEFASKQKPKAEQVDVPEGSDMTPREADRANDTTSGDLYYLFGPDRYPIGPDGEPLREGDYEPSTSCKSLLADYDAGGGQAPEFAKGTECQSQLEELGSSAARRPARRCSRCPRGIVIVEGERAPNQSERVHRYFVIEDDAELSGKEIKNPEQGFDPNTNAPLVNMEFTDTGREAFAAVTKRIAERGRDCETLAGVDPNCPNLPPGSPPDDYFQRFAITLDNTIVSLATIDYQENPEGIDGRTGASIQNIGTISEAQDLAESLRIGALPINLKLISQTQVSATLGQQALDQGLTAAAAGLALTILFLLIFYRVLGAVATVTLLLYAAFLFALVKLIPITLTLPGIAGMVLTLAVAADANIVMYERIKEEVRSGQIGAGRHLRGLREGAPDDHRRERRDDRRGVHPVHARDGRRARVRVHARSRHARLAVHRRAGDLGDPRLARADEAAPAAERARRRHQGARGLEVRLHGQLALVLLVLGRDPRRRRDRDLDARAQLRHRLRVGHADDRAAPAGGERRRRPRHARAARVRRRRDPGGRGPRARRERRADRGRAARAAAGQRGRGGS